MRVLVHGVERRQVILALEVDAAVGAHGAHDVGRFDAGRVAELRHAGR